MFAALQTPGPVYVRLGRGVGAPLHLEPEAVDFRVGKGEVLREGSDVTLAAVGVMVERALRAAELLEAEGVSAAVINLRSVKPIDRELLWEYADRTGAIVTAEDHNCFGGVFGAVAETVAKRRPVPMEQVALEDTFGESGNGALLLEKYGLTAERIVSRARAAIARKG